MISIVVLVKNRERNLRNLLLGIHRLDYSSLETIVVHMNEPLQPPPDFFAGKYTAIEIQNPETQLPLTQARNQGAKIARGDHLIFLDVDCIPAGKFLADYSRAFDKVPQAVVTGTVYYLDNPVPENWQEADLIKQGGLHPLRLYPETGTLQLNSDYHLFWSLNFGLSNSVWDKIGGFDERFQGYGAEDTDFAFSAKEKGVELAWLGGGTVFHQPHDLYDPPLQYFGDIIQNSELFYQKWQWWPMKYWLQQFVDAGYIQWSPVDPTITVVLEPTEEMIAAALCKRI